MNDLVEIIILEYHWIYRFVVQDQSIRLMDESCGYIEQVDDDSVYDFITGKYLGSKLTTMRRKGKDRKTKSMGRRHRFRGYRRRQPSSKDEFGLDTSTLTEDFKNRSLLDEPEEEYPSAIGIRSQINPGNKTNAYKNLHDMKNTKRLEKAGVI